MDNAPSLALFYQSNEPTFSKASLFIFQMLRLLKSGFVFGFSHVIKNVSFGLHSNETTPFLFNDVITFLLFISITWIPLTSTIAKYFPVFGENFAISADANSGYPVS